MINDETREALRKVFHWSVPVSYLAAEQRLFTFLPEQLEEFVEVIKASKGLRHEDEERTLRVHQKCDGGD